MARLKKHGKELLRIEQEREVTDDSSITWQKWTRTYHADGKVLQKIDVRFKPDAIRPKGEFYSYGWKITGTIKKDRTPEQAVANIVSALRAKGDAAKWKIVFSGGTAPVIIEQEQIVRAIESGEMVGFCKECGAEVSGVEPDARNGRCDSCGAMAVYGAEEMLISL